MALRLLSQEGAGLNYCLVAGIQMQENFHRLAGLLVRALPKLVRKQSLEASQLGLATDLSRRGAGRGNNPRAHDSGFLSPQGFRVDRLGILWQNFRGCSVWAGSSCRARRGCATLPDGLRSKAFARSGR